MVAGNPVRMDAFYSNRGNLPVQNALIWANVLFVEIEPNPDADTEISNLYRRGVELTHKQNPVAGNNLGVSKEIWTSGYSQLVTMTMIDGLRVGKWKMYLLSMVLWNDEDGTPHELLTCEWMDHISHGPDRLSEAIHSCATLGPTPSSFAPQTTTVDQGDHLPSPAPRPCTATGIIIDSKKSISSNLKVYGCVGTGVEIHGEKNTVNGVTVAPRQSSPPQ